MPFDEMIKLAEKNKIPKVIVPSVHLGYILTKYRGIPIVIKEKSDAGTKKRR
jgi:hypothetical protein